MTKQMAALAAAISMTVCVAAAILAIGGFSVLNKSGVAPASSGLAAPQPVQASLNQSTQVGQLEQQISQYQSREQQFQQALQQAQAQLQQDQQQLQQYQQLFAALQQAGVIGLQGSDGD